MSERTAESATDRVRRFLAARDGYFPIDVLAVVTRTGDRLLASDLRALVDALARVEALADEWDHDIAELHASARGDGDMVADWHADARQQHLRQLRAALDVDCPTCSGRGVWMDEPCADCAPFYCYPCARGDHDEHKVAWVPAIPCECPECVTPPGSSANHA